jgi:hypothetical protein
VATRKSPQYPYRWPNGTYHSRPYAGGNGPTSQLVGTATPGAAGLGGAGPAKGVQRAPNPAPGVGTPPGQPQAGPAPFTPDAEYLAAAAQRQFDRTKALEGLTSQTTNDKTDTSEAIRRLLQGAPEQRQGITQNANRAGLFYSGQLGKQLTDYESNLTRAQGDIQLDYDRREQARAAARAAIEQGASLEEAAALAESATRQVGRDADAAAANSLVPTPLPAPPPTAANRPVSRAATARRLAAARRRPPTRRRA